MVYCKLKHSVPNKHSDCPRIFLKLICFPFILRDVTCYMCNYFLSHFVNIYFANKLYLCFILHATPGVLQVAFAPFDWVTMGVVGVLAGCEGIKHISNKCAAHT